MKRLKGPELKAPAFLADLYYDLRDRRLLPLLALVVVAIVAVPFLLGGGSEEAAPAPESATAEAGISSVDAGKLTVVEAKPGLRDYRKRLADRTPDDPFRPNVTASSTGGGGLPDPVEAPSSGTGSEGAPSSSEGGSEPVSVSGGEGESSPPPPPSADPSPQPSGDAGPKKGRLTFYAFAIDVRITKAGGKNASKSKKAEPIVRKRVLPQTALPGDKAPVVTYMGPATRKKKATGKALLLVSDNVESVFGETRCVSGKDVCQLIEVEPGFPVTFVYGANEVRYTVNVLKMGLVVTGRAKYSQEVPWDSQSFSK